MKKRLFAAFVSAVMILPNSYAAVQAAEPAEFGMVLLAEDFETDAPDDGTPISGWNNWEQDKDGTDASTFNSSNTIETDGTNKVASIRRTATTATDLGSYYFKKPISVPDGSDVISVKFRTRRTDTNAAGLIVRLYGPNAGNNGELKGNTYFFMNAGNGYLWWKDGGAATYRYPLSGANSIGTVNTWYNVEIRVDYANKKIEAYVENTYAGYANLKDDFSNIYGLPTAISFGTPRAATYWGGMETNARDAEFQIDDIVVTAYKGNLAYSSPAGGEESVDVYSSEIELIFNYEIADTSNAEYTLTSQETAQIPLITEITYDSENRRKVTIKLDGNFDYGKKYTILSSGVKNMYSKEMPVKVEFTSRERRFMIDSPVFTASGAPITAISDDAVSAKVRIENEFASEKPLTVVAASFSENGRLKDVDYTVTSVAAEDCAEPELTVNAEENGKIRLLVLDSFSALNPVIGEYIFDSRGLSEPPSEVTPVQASGISATIDYDGSGKATISGSAGDGNLAVLVLKPNYTLDDLTEANRAAADSMLEYIGLTKGGEYSAAYVPRTPVDNLNFYNAYATGISVPKPFRVFDAETVTNVLNAVKNSTKETLRDMLKAQNPVLLNGININDVLALNLADYYTLTEPELVTAELAGQTFENVSSLRAHYNETLLQKLEYEKVRKEIISAVNDAMWNDLETLLRNNDSVLMLDWTGDYEKISNKDNFYKKLANDYTFTAEGTTVTQAIKNIRDVFSSLAKTVAKSESDADRNKGSSSGGGGGSRMVKMPVQTVTVPENNKDGGTDFSDISEAEWAEAAIKALVKKNIINGMGDGRFEPNAAVTREQFVKMLVLAFEFPMEFSDAPFIDVTAADWFYHYVHTAYKNGIVQDASVFGAGRAITRAEMAAMCYRAAQAGGMSFDDGASFEFADSSSIPGYAKEAVAKLSKCGIINGVGENIFAPDDNSSRAQAAKIIYGILKLKGGID